MYRTGSRSRPSAATSGACTHPHREGWDRAWSATRSPAMVPGSSAARGKVRWMARSVVLKA